MALEDFVASDPHAARSTGARRAVAPEDEDLFDFPTIEMKLAGRSPAPKPALPNAARSADVEALAIELETRAPARAAGGTARQLSDVAIAAGLVSELERILPDSARPPAVSEPSAKAAGAQTPLLSKQALLGFGAFLLVNAAAFLFWWKSTADFRASLEGLRSDLTFAAREIPTQVIEPGSQAALGTSGPLATPEPVSTANATPPEAPDTRGAPSARGASSVVPLESFERTALEIARIEIESGEFSAARRRLQRLLAVVDRVEASVRDDIEAQAAFLLAESYRREAQSRREVAR